ncbi:hypothetical protein [Solimonas sp. SE-A11]|nr:hypothetical protein [Solimonas sp. SE-A11]MDM4772461.1 hypothetical protein [Solimonas sp. SE-A11]
MQIPVEKEVGGQIKGRAFWRSDYAKAKHRSDEAEISSHYRM